MAAILGLGLDITSVERVSSTLGGARGQRFLERVFTASEREYCEARKDPAQRASAYAARFAAKEAFVKALGVPKGISWLDIEVVRARGAPTLRLHGRAAEVLDRRSASAMLTLSHDGGLAAAVVVIVGTEPKKKRGSR